MTDDERKIYDQLIEKSVEAFTLAIELYNRPSVKYRVEGFAFFICNAWELMLKARLIDRRGIGSIYYKDSPERTKTLEACADLVFTNTKDPLSKNLKAISKLRNTGTHFIVEEYEQIYVSLFQACVSNYDDKMFEFHGVRISDHLPKHFLMLSMSANPLNPETIRAKYPPEIAERVLFDEAEIRQEELMEASQRYSIVIRTEMAVVKKPENADFKVSYDKTSEKGIRVAKQFVDPSTTHPLSVSKIIELVNRHLRKDGVVMLSHGKPHDFTSNDWKLFMKFYGIKEDKSLCYEHNVTSTPSYSYSMKTVDLIVEHIEDDPAHIIEDLKKGLEKRARQ